MARGFRVFFDAPELNNVLNNMGRYNTRTAVKIEKVISNSTKNIAQGVRRRVPVRSGKTKKAVRTRFDTKKVQGTVAIKKPHAHLIEFGAKATVEKPDRKKAMAIDQFGIRRYAKKVNIPARAAHPSMRPAYEDEKPMLLKELREAVQP